MGTPGVARSVFYPRLQVRVRGETGVTQEPRKTCRDLMALVQRTRKLTNYVSMLVNESEPIDLGEGVGGYEFGFNIDLVFSSA
jgi:hypothetical protein